MSNIKIRTLVPVVLVESTSLSVRRRRRQKQQQQRRRSISKLLLVTSWACVLISNCCCNVVVHAFTIIRTTRTTGHSSSCGRLGRCNGLVEDIQRQSLVLLSSPTKSSFEGSDTNNKLQEEEEEEDKDDDDDMMMEETATENQEDHEQLNIAFVTGNQMKVRELEMILSEHLSKSYNQSKKDGLQVDNLAFNVRIINVDLPEIQEVNTEAIAKEKALLAAQLAGGPCLVEDTSLMFHALGGMPGPYIKWFQERLKSEGLYNILMAYSDKSATAICTLAFCPVPHADPVLFTGSIDGTIVAPVVDGGGGGFGWDSIFVPNGSNVPFSAMTTEQKNKFSHRGKAVRQWAQWVSSNRSELLKRQQGSQAIGHKGLDFKCISPEQ